MNTMTRRVAGAGMMSAGMYGFGNHMIIGNAYAGGIKETAVAATIDVTMRRD